MATPLCGMCEHEGCLICAGLESALRQELPPLVVPTPFPLPEHYTGGPLVASREWGDVRAEPFIPERCGISDEAIAATEKQLRECLEIVAAKVFSSSSGYVADRSKTLRMEDLMASIRKVARGG